ncbi:MAG: ribonuclease R [Pseudomonadota bacterium]
MPTRDELIAHLKENPQETGKRELARAFGLKGNDKIALKALLRELTEEGIIKKRGRKIAQPGTLPNVTVLDITARDRDGGLLARPVQWDEKVDGKHPVVAIVVDRSGKSPTAGLGDRVLARISTRDKGSPRGRIIKVLDRNRGKQLGIYRAAKDPSDGLAGRIEPTDRKQNELLVRAGQEGGAKDGDLVEVAIASRNAQGLKQARVEDVIGNINSEKAISLIALHQHNIPTGFPQAVIAGSKAVRAETADTMKPWREDWRDVPLITIDPADAKDHDDAVYAEPDTAANNKGGVIVTVAIADVAAYIDYPSALDDEARKRGNSVYFPDRVVPMLPERISNDLCSLREQEDRPALAVRMVFDADGTKRSHKFHRIMMRSHARLSYQEAQAAIDGEDAPRAEPWLEPVLKSLWHAYAVLSKGRAARAPLELDMPERKILLKPDGGVDRVIVPPRLDAHKLIEEFMIQANVAAAESLEKERQPLIYRIHDAPSLAKLESLREFLRTLNIPLAKPGQLRPAAFNGILEQLKGSENQDLVNQVVLRSQSQAEYNPQNIGHFGLHLAKYAHFTSPIRRYADLIVHRALVRSLSLGDGGLHEQQIGELDAIAEEISLAERRAMLAERQTVDRLIATHLADKIGAEFPGRINGVTRAGLFITLDETGADGFVPISQLGDDYFIYDEASHRVVGEHSALQFQMGDRVTLRLVEAAPVAGALRFDMISEGTESSQLPRGRRTRPNTTGGRGKGKGKNKSRGGSGASTKAGVKAGPGRARRSNRGKR